MKSVGYSEDEMVTITSRELDFDCIEHRIILDERSAKLSNIPFPVIYEKELDAMKRKVFTQAMKHAIVDSGPLLDEDLYDRRYVNVRLYVGKH